MELTEKQDFTSYLIDEKWSVTPNLLEIAWNEASVIVGPKVMQVLVFLLQRPGKVATRTELMDEVWGGSFVVEESLTRCISELRKIFGDNPSQPHVIRTVRNVGYVLIASVQKGELLSTSETTQVDKTRPTRRRWIPLVALSLLISWAAATATSKVINANISKTVLNAIPMTTGKGVERDGTVSPDERSIAYAFKSSGSSNYDVQIKDTKTGITTAIGSTPSDEVSPAWSPDGRILALIRKEKGQCEIIAYNIDLASERLLSTCVFNIVGDLVWSPDGRLLAYSDVIGDTPQWSIYLLDATTGNRTQLTVPRDGIHGDFAPSFSPDGKYMAFTRVDFEESRDIYVIEITGENERRLTSEQRAITGHAWSSDGEWIYYASDRSDVNGIWRIPMQGGLSKWVPLAHADVRTPEITTTGKLSFEVWSTESNIYQVGRETTATLSESMPLISSTFDDTSPQFAPDGSAVVLVSDRSGSPQLWLYTFDNQSERQLTFANGTVSSPQWSRDGRFIVYTEYADGDRDIALHHVQSGHTHYLTDTPFDEGLPELTADGQTLFFTSDRDGYWRIYEYDIAGKETKPVTERRSVFTRLSGDGQSIYFAGDDGQGIWKKTLNVEPAEQVVDDLHETDWGNWSVTDDAIYYVRRDAKGDQVVRLELASGEVRVELQLEHSWMIKNNEPAFAVAPDEKSFLMVMVDREESNIYMTTESLK